MLEGRLREDTIIDYSGIICFLKSRPLHLWVGGIQ